MHDDGKFTCAIRIRTHVPDDFQTLELTRGASTPYMAVTHHCSQNVQAHFSVNCGTIEQQKRALLGDALNLLPTYASGTVMILILGRFCKPNFGSVFGKVRVRFRPGRVEVLPKPSGRILRSANRISFSVRFGREALPVMATRHRDVQEEYEDLATLLLLDHEEGGRGRVAPAKPISKSKRMVFRVSDVEDGDPALAMAFGAGVDPTLALDEAASEEDRGWLELQVEAQLDDAELESDMAGSRK